MYKTIEIETKSGNLVELETESSYVPSHIGGSFENFDHEKLGDDYELNYIYRNGIDITERIKKFCKGLFEKIETKINEE